MRRKANSIHVNCITSGGQIRSFLMRALPMFVLKMRIVSAVLLIAVLTGTAAARVVRVEITSRADIENGKAFGNVGPYEKITGRVFFAADPANPHNRQIVDLDKAPRNTQGGVEFSADLYLLKPKDIIKGNQAVLLRFPIAAGAGAFRSSLD